MPRTPLQNPMHMAALDLCFQCRALGERTDLEYAPWATASPLVLRVRQLLGGGTSPAGCAAAWGDFVRKNVTMPWVGGARLTECAPPRVWLCCFLLGYTHQCVMRNRAQGGKPVRDSMREGSGSRVKPNFG